MRTKDLVTMILRVIFIRKYSVRRFYIDSFFMKHQQRWNKNDSILDIGGRKTNKKGCFNIETNHNNVTYLNNDISVNPDYLCDATAINEKDSSYNIVICSELLEHVYSYKEVLKEIYRVLKSEGYAYICVPFSVHIHDYPDDYYRFTKSYWIRALSDIGFEVINIQEQGGYFAVRGNMAKVFMKMIKRRKSLKIFYYLLYPFLCLKMFILMLLEITVNTSKMGYTTGYGIYCKK